jgi:carboxypeptidase T
MSTVPWHRTASPGRPGRRNPVRVALPHLAAAFSVAVLVGVALPSPAAAASPDPDNFGSTSVTTETIAAADQYSLAAALSRRMRPSGSAPVVYLVSGETAGSGLAAGPAAARDGGVILYTAAASLPQATAGELARLAPPRVVVVGSPAAISDGVLTQVAALLPAASVERVGGDAASAAATLSARTFATNTGATFHTITPGRVLDSRIGLGAGLFHSQVAQSFAVGGLFGVPVDAVAVTGNVTVVGQSYRGYVTIAPGLSSGVQPPTSTLNFPVGDIRANGVTVPLGPNGRLDAMYWATSKTARTHLVFDVTGYLANDSNGASFSAVTPGRVMDSRLSLGAGLFRSQEKQSFAVAGLFGVPADAVAITGNVTVVNQTYRGYVTIAPSLSSGVQPPTSTLNFPVGDIRANSVTVPLGPGGKLDAMYWATHADATADLVFDVTGYFAHGTDGAVFHPVAPGRVVDTRIALGAAPHRSQVAQSFAVAGLFGVPGDAVAVTGNVTEVNATYPGYVTVAPELSSGVQPPTSTVNFPVGDIRANGVVAPLGSDGRLETMYWATPTTPTTDLVIDVTGYFVPEPDTVPYHASASVVIASADAPADAVVAASVAARLGTPYLLINRSGVPAATAAELARLKPDRALLIDDATAVPDTVLRLLRTLVPSVDRVAGTSTQDTSGVVAARFFPDATAVTVTSASPYTSGLAAVPLAGAQRQPILYLDGSDVLTNEVRDALISLRPKHVLCVGEVSILNQAEVVGFSDGRIAKPLDTATYPAFDSGYHDPGELYQLIEAEQIAYPDLVRVFSIGQSYQGRDILAAKVSSDVTLDEGKPETLIDALHHADEHIGVEQAIYLLETLTSEYGTDSFVHQLVDERVVWIVFSLNPDGWHYDLGGGTYHYWRKNRQPNSGSSYVGTDINRNYPYKWACCGGSSSSPGAWNYRGASSLSTPEARALADFVNSRVVDGKQRIETHLTLHANGELILYPYAYTRAALPADMTADDHAVFVKMAQTMSSLNGYQYEQSSAMYVTDGDEIDWLYHQYRIFSFTIELYPVEQATSYRNYYPYYSAVPAQMARNRDMLLYVIDVAACPYAVVGLEATHCQGSPQIIPSGAVPKYAPVQAQARPATQDSTGEPAGPE